MTKTTNVAETVLENDSIQGPSLSVVEKFIKTNSDADKSNLANEMASDDSPVSPTEIGINESESLTAVSGLVDDHHKEAKVSSLPKSKPSKLRFTKANGVVCPDRITNEDALELQKTILKAVDTLGYTISDFDVRVSSDGGEFDLLIQASTLNYYGMDRYALDYTTYAHEFGLEPKWHGKVFKYREMQLVITGLKIKNRSIRVFNGHTSFWIRENSVPGLIKLFTEHQHKES
ncbi:MAG: hypothetical protein HAW67_05820 [Endozoicomonadaceae bacterium]|nr:hypothetical protein [Endozoicomonadaceae bacterium]